MTTKRWTCTCLRKWRLVSTTTVKSTLCRDSRETGTLGSSVVRPIRRQQRPQRFEPLSFQLTPVERRVPSIGLHRFVQEATSPSR